MAVTGLSLAPAALGALVFALLASDGNPRPKAPDLSVQPSVSVMEKETPHLSFVAALSSASVEPGARLSITVDVTPKPGIHVYAPGNDYRPIVLKLKPQPELRIHEAVYPEPTLYFYKPLNEAVLVYSRRFRLVVDVTAGPTPQERARLRKRKTLQIDGQVEYQACDDRHCYLPVSVPVEWTLRIRAGEGSRGPG